MTKKVSTAERRRLVSLPPSQRWIDEDADLDNLSDEELLGFHLSTYRLAYGSEDPEFPGTFSPGRFVSRIVKFVETQFDGDRTRWVRWVRDAHSWAAERFSAGERWPGRALSLDDLLDPNWLRRWGGEIGGRSDSRSRYTGIVAESVGPSEPDPIEDAFAALPTEEQARIEGLIAEEVRFGLPPSTNVGDLWARAIRRDVIATELARLDVEVEGTLAEIARLEVQTEAAIAALPMLVRTDIESRAAAAADRFVSPLASEQARRRWIRGERLRLGKAHIQTAKRPSSSEAASSGPAPEIGPDPDSDA